MMQFRDRQDAGRKLAEKLMEYKGKGVLVLGLPRGGVPVAYEVAHALEASLDIFVVRKLGVPEQPELAMGAIASGNVRVLNEDVIQLLDIPPETIEAVTAREQQELERREREYRGNRHYPIIENRTVILIDDGLATGASMRAAVLALRQLNPEKIIVAVPTAPPETCAEFESHVDAIICAVTPTRFLGVGGSYLDFSQTSDEEVQELLRKDLEESTGPC